LPSLGTTITSGGLGRTGVLRAIILVAAITSFTGLVTMTVNLRVELTEAVAILRSGAISIKVGPLFPRLSSNGAKKTSGEIAGHIGKTKS
jgi:hypothetical protein